MSEKKRPEVISALPHKRPHRRSDKRAARPAPAASVPAVSAPPAEETPAETPVAQTPAASGSSRSKAAGAQRTKRTGIAERSTVKTPTAPAARSTPRSGKRLPQPAQPRGVPDARRPRHPVANNEEAPSGFVGTAVHAAAELAEIGLSVSARALRQAVSRLPKP